MENFSSKQLFTCVRSQCKMQEPTNLRTMFFLQTQLFPSIWTSQTTCPFRKGATIAYMWQSRCFIKMESPQWIICSSATLERANHTFTKTLRILWKKKAKKFPKLLQSVFGANCKFGMFEKFCLISFIPCINLSLFFLYVTVLQTRAIIIYKTYPNRHLQQNKCKMHHSVE